ncbi:DUF305 domain-containing protein [Azohydromonas lata]|uniref:DUF305 domain-containing protein n=1 Tax=Azohydromonas lata TaxID=45677 RepID=A0ABU5IQ95_9BURK|nr:DUF305 domain-containing protein [Azohydromonas lata]MDZ5461077.1 DUF305 domain-containing protein [Azohydromonas lata]
MSGLTLLASGAALAQPASAPMHGGAAASGPLHGGAGQMDMHQAMRHGAQAMQDMKPTGNLDRDFAAMMRMHHQQAVEMSQAYLKQAKSPEMRAMAQKIIRDQKREIVQFDKWLRAHK